MEIPPKVREYLDGLLARIEDPKTSPEEQDSLRDDFQAIACGYIDNGGEDHEPVAGMKPNPPSHDAIMRALAGIMENFSWTQFQPILNDPAKLQDWLRKTVQPEPGEVTPLDPDDPVVEERATLSADEEQKAMEFWSELNAEEQEKIRVAVSEIWGRDGVATLPMALRLRRR